MYCCCNEKLTHSFKTIIELWEIIYKVLSALNEQTLNKEINQCRLLCRINKRL